MVRCLVLCVMLIPACDDGAGSGDFVTTEGTTTTRYDELASEDAPWGHDPEIFAQEETTIEGIEVGLWSGYTGTGPADGFMDYLFLNFKETLAPGEVITDDNTFSALYRAGDDLYVANAFIDDSSGNASLTAVGELGQPVRGRYQLTLCKSVNGADFPRDCAAGSLELSGNFEATREARGTSGRGRE